MVKFIFTGAQGTGKTTVLNEFRKQGFNVITEVVRSLSKTGININEQGDEQGQETIFNEYVKLLSADTDYISDRGLTDVYSYTMWLHKHKGCISASTIDKQLTAIKEFNRTNPDAVYFYFPIEFDVVDDGVRSIDEDFRKEIDRLILDALRNSGSNYIEVRGTVEERVAIVKKAMAVESQNK